MTMIVRTLLAAMTIAAPFSAPVGAADLQPPEGGSTAAVAPSAAVPCESAQNRQFDFWLGQWEVTNPAGQLAGRSRIEAILDGCVLLENWDSPSGVSGKSFNIFNAATGHWEQFWVDNSGSRLHLSGGMHEGNMVLQGVQDKAGASTGVAQRERITWTPNADGSVRQHWETSSDDGKSWKTSFDGLYRHPAGGSAD
jgi:hypothetical protein